MLPVKLVRSLVLGETMSNPFHHDDDNATAHDADDEHDDNDGGKLVKKKRRKTPLLLFLPSRELISDTFRLAAIARDIGMDFHPSPSLSHLFFSWPSPSSSPSTSSPSSSSSSSSPFSTHRPSFSSTTTTATTSSSTSSALQNDAVPLPFPSLSSPSVSLSLLRYFVSLSRGLFKLVFLRPDCEFDPNWFNNWVHECPNLALFSRVSNRRVGSMDELSRELAGRGWMMFRAAKTENSVYLFRKLDTNRVRVRIRGKGGGGGEGECRVRELRLPALDFKKGVPLRVLLYIVLMADDIFYLA